MNLLSRLKLGLSPNWVMEYIAGPNRYLGTTMVGGPGTGKTSFIRSCWQQDELYGTSRMLIDPARFLAMDALAISHGQALYCSQETPLSLNIMAQPYHENQIVDTVCEAINQVIALTTSNQSLTARMRAILQESILYNLKRNRKSLINVRDHIAQGKQDVTTEGILARLNYLLGDAQVNRIICGNNPLEVGSFSKSGKAFILDCFGMSRERMLFVGNLLSQTVKNYFLYQRPKTYSPLALYIDEAHNFVNPNLFDILKEGRKYKLACLLATQDFALVGEKLARVMLNVGNLVAFRVGYKEASLLAREMGLTPETLQFLPKYYLAYKTVDRVGIVKAPRPPFVKPLQLGKRPPHGPVMPVAEPRPEWKGWFPLEQTESSV